MATAASKRSQKHLQQSKGSSCVSSTRLLVHRDGDTGCFTPEDKVIILITAVYYVLPAIPFRRGSSECPVQVCLHSSGQQQMLFAQVSRGLLWLPRAAEGHGVPPAQPELLCRALPCSVLCQLPMGALGRGCCCHSGCDGTAVRASPERHCKHCRSIPHQHYLEKTPLSLLTEPRTFECCHGQGLRELSAVTGHCQGPARATAREPQGKAGVMDGPEEPPKTQARVRKCITKRQGSGGR